MNLADPTELRPFLDRHGYAPNKELGQHFLVSQKAVNQIVAAAAGLAGVLEVGPGPGVLTQRLCEAGPVVAIDLDPRSASALAEAAPSADARTLDALSNDLAGLLVGLPEPRGIVSNMPYNITGPLLSRFADVRGFVERLILMMQREVAEKILAQPGDRTRGALSVVMQLQFDILPVAKVPPGAFLPPPKVESSVLRFVPRQRHEHEERLIKLVHQGFEQPRKTLANNLRPLGPSAEWIAKVGLEPSVRPHQMAERDWLAIFECCRG